MSSREETIKHIRQHIPDESTVDADKQARLIAEVVIRARHRQQAQKCQPKDAKERVVDDETKLTAMIALADVPELTAEVWTDHRICGMTQIEIARREGVSRERIHQRIKRADSLILRFLGRRPS